LGSKSGYGKFATFLTREAFDTNTPWVLRHELEHLRKFLEIGLLIDVGSSTDVE